MSTSPESFALSEADSVTWERRAPRPEDDHLLAHTQNWLGALPKGIRPVHLQAKFPRIANDLSRLWPEPAALDHYFAEKEFSPRTDRRGFPPLIKEEHALHARLLAAQSACAGRTSRPEAGVASQLRGLRAAFASPATRAPRRPGSVEQAIAKAPATPWPTPRRTVLSQ